MPTVAADEGVSPVIGVILLVAITVVLATVVFLLATSLSRPNPDEATFFGNADDQRDRIDVLKVEGAASFSDFRISSESAAAGVTGIRFAINAVPTSATGTASANGASTDIAAVQDMKAGDYIGLCSTGAAATNTEVRIVHIHANSQVLKVNYTSLALCT